MIKKIMLTVGMLAILSSPASAYEGHGHGRGHGGDFMPGIIAGSILGLGAGVALGEALAPQPYYAAPTYYYSTAPVYVYPSAPICRQYTQSVLQPDGYYVRYIGTACQGADGNWYVQGR